MRAIRRRTRRVSPLERLEGRVLLVAGAIDVQFARALAGPGQVTNLVSTLDPQGQLFLGGTFTGTLDFDTDPAPGQVASRTSTAGGPGDGFLAKYTPQGALDWVRTFAVPAGQQFAMTGVAVGPTGEVVAIGASTPGVDLDLDPGLDATPPGAGGFVVTLGPQGAFVSAARFEVAIGGPTANTPSAVAVDQAGAVFVAGNLAGGSHDLDPGPAAITVPSPPATAYLVKLNPSQGQTRGLAFARVLQTATAVPSDSVTIRDLALAPGAGGDVYLVGGFRGSVNFDPAPGPGRQVRTSTPTTSLVDEDRSDGFVLRLSALNGDYRAVQTVGGDGFDEFNRVALITSGNAVDGVVAAGTATGGVALGGTVPPVPGRGGRDVVVARWAADLTPIWARLIGNEADNAPADLAVDPAGNVLFGGTFSGTLDLDPGAINRPVTAQGASDAYLVALDGGGGYLYGFEFGGSGAEQLGQIDSRAPGVVSFTGTYQGASEIRGIPLPTASAGQVGALVGRVAVTGDITAPGIEAIVPLPAARNTPVGPVEVVFNEPIVPGSLGIGVVSLTRNGANVPLTGVAVAPVPGDPTRYRITGLEALTGADGDYVLRVDATGVADLAGNPGVGVFEGRFTVDTVPPLLVSLGPVDPVVRETALGSIDAVFSEPIIPETLLAAATLTRDGVPVALTDAGVSQVAGDPTRYRITGLEAATGFLGTYVLTVDAAGVRDLANNAGQGIRSAQFTVREGPPAPEPPPGTPGVPDDSPGAPRRVIGDYDGDGVADLALYRHDPARRVGVFSVLMSNNGSPVERRIELANVDANAIPIAGDFDGDGRTDAAVVNPTARLFGSAEPNASVWIIRDSSTGQTREVPFGAAGVLDRPAPADYDGDGITDIATFRANSDLVPGAAQWFILPSATNQAFDVLFGAAGGTDLPAPADYDGDGKADIATFRPVSDLDPGAARWSILPSGPNTPNYRTTVGGYPIVFGAAGNADQPVAADYNGDGRADIAAFRSVTDLPDNIRWFVLPSAGPVPNYGSGFPVGFGPDGAIAAVSDYNRDGRPDLAYFNRTTNAWTIREGVDGPTRTVPFNPLGSGAVPVLSPLFFRLDATGNPTTFASAGRRAGDSLALLGAPDSPVMPLVADRPRRDDLVDSALDDLSGGEPRLDA